MRVIFVTYNHLNTNSGIHIYNIAQSLEIKGVECAVFVPGSKETVYEFGEPEFQVFNYTDIDKVDFVPDIIHAWTPRECVRKHVLRLVKIYKCPYIVHLEDNEECLLMHEMGLSADQIIAIQHGNVDIVVPEGLSHPRHYKDFLAGALGMTALIDKLLYFKPVNVRGFVFWPGYDKLFEDLPNAGDNLRTELGIKKGDHVIVYMGNVHASNRDEIFSLYSAVNLLNKKNIPTKLIRTGEDYVTLVPPEAKELDEHIVKLGFLPREELPKLLGLADILVQPGQAGDFNDFRFPSKLPDYFISGKPVILPAANIGRFLKDGENCVLLASGDAKEIAEKAEGLLADANKREQIGAAGKAFAAKNFSWHNNAFILLDFYQELLELSCLKSLAKLNSSKEACPELSGLVEELDRICFRFILSPDYRDKSYEVLLHSLNETNDYKKLSKLTAEAPDYIPSYEFVRLISHLASFADKYNDEISAIYASRSWRLTSPLRYVSIRLTHIKKYAWDIGYALRAVQRVWRQEGWSGVKNRIHLYIKKLPFFATNSYQEWIELYDSLTDKKRTKIKQRITAMKQRPLISVVMPVYTPSVDLLEQAINSVQAQLYPNWELCIAYDNSLDRRIRNLLEKYTENDSRIKLIFSEENGHISEGFNSALNIVTGDYVGLLGHDDLLPEHSLFHVAEEINKYPGVELIYSDEDKINKNGKRCLPHFKPDLNLDLLLSQNYICHLLVIKTDLLTEVGGFRKGYEGAQDHDLVIRCIERIKHDKVRHIPKVLYHWRMHKHSTAATAAAKEHTNDAGIKLLNDYIDRNKLNAMVCPGLVPNSYRIKYAINGNPLVSIIIPTKDQIDLLKTCIDSIENRTSYRNYEIIIVNNRSLEPSTTQYFQELSQKDHIQIIDYDDVFNYSNINNYAVEKAAGEYICLMNNDIEAISPEWLEEMLSQAMRPEIGCVGAKLYYPNNKIQHGGIILGIGGVAGHSHKYFEKDASGYHSCLKLVQNISAVTAACLVVSKDVFIQVGGFDGKNLKVAFNDIDFCLRVRDLGLSNLWSPYAELYHHESISRGQEDTPEKRKRFHDEINYMTKRWGKELTEDPCYNSNLSKEFEDFSLKL